MEDADKEFMTKMKPGDIIVADKNFGCGSSREHAPIAIKAAGVSCVIARSYARIFYRNAFNMGLPIFESAEAVDGITAGDEVEVDVDSGIIKNITKGETYKAQAIPPFMQELINERSDEACGRQARG
jgi:3-isopropylmalate dehydratase small subunit